MSDQFSSGFSRLSFNQGSRPEDWSSPSQSPSTSRRPDSHLHRPAPHTPHHLATQEFHEPRFQSNYGSPSHPYPARSQLSQYSQHANSEQNSYGYHRGLYQPAHSLSVRHQVTPTIIFQIHTFDQKSDDEIIEHARQLFQNWRNNPDACLQSLRNQVQLVRPATNSQSPYYLLEWVYLNTQGRVSLPEIASKIGLGDVRPTFNKQQNIAANLQEMQLLFSRLSEQEQIDFISSTAKKVLPEAISAHTTHQLHCYYSKTCWEFHPFNGLQEGHYCRFGAFSLPVQYHDELSAIHHCLNNVCQLGHLIFELLDPSFKQFRGIRPAPGTHELYALAETVFSHHTYGTKSNAFLDLPVFIREWLTISMQVLDRENDLCRLPRYQSLCAAKSAVEFLWTCQKYSLTTFPDYSFLKSEKLTISIRDDEQRLTSKLSLEDALSIIRSHNKKVPIQKIEQAGSGYRGLHTVIKHLFPNEEFISPTELAIVMILSDQSLRLLNKLLPPIITSAFWSLPDGIPLNTFTELKPDNERLKRLVKQQNVIRRLKSSNISPSQLQQWLKSTGDNFWDHTLSVPQRWLVFSPKANKSILVRVECDLLKTDITPPSQQYPYPCPSAEDCIQGLVNTPFGMIAPEYFRVNHRKRSSSGADCDICRAHIFRIDYNEQTIKSSKKHHVLHCSEHGHDVCDACIPKWVVA